MNTINFDRGCTIAPILRGEVVAPDWCIERFFEALEAGAEAAAEEVFHQWCCHPEWGDFIAIRATRLPEGLDVEQLAAEMFERGIYFVREYEVEWLTHSCVVMSKRIKSISEDDAIRTLLREESDINPEASAWPRVVAA